LGLGLGLGQPAGELLRQRRFTLTTITAIVVLWSSYLQFYDSAGLWSGLGLGLAVAVTLSKVIRRGQ